MVFDPATREWVVEPEPEPGTDVGDLEIARRTLADGQARRAQRQLEDWIKFYANESELHPEAILLLGRAEFELGNYITAHKHYRSLVNGWPGTEWADQAARADFVVAEVLLSGKRRKVMGMPMLPAQDEGLDILDQISVDFAGTPLAEEAIKTRADYHYRRGEFDFAEDAYARLAREYPNSPHLRYAMLRSAESALGQFGGIEFDDAPLVEAEERFDQYRARFPQAATQDEDVELVRAQIDNERAHKEYKTAAYYRRVGKFRAAAYYFRFVIREWPESTWADTARADLASIEPFVESITDEEREAEPLRTPIMGETSAP
jgi:outer membrane protein assembly factor BamD (BamD/ComL family)